VTADKVNMLAARSHEDGRRARRAPRRLLRAGDRADPAAAVVAVLVDRPLGATTPADLNAAPDTRSDDIALGGG
jgi:hypothetical protein